MQVVKASDVLFLFGSLADIRDTIKSIKGDLKGHQIVVPVTKEGDLDVFQVDADSACLSAIITHLTGKQCFLFHQLQEMCCTAVRIFWL